MSAAREPWGLPAPSNDNAAHPDPIALVIGLSLIIGAGLGCATTIAAYALRVLS